MVQEINISDYPDYFFIQIVEMYSINIHKDINVYLLNTKRIICIYSTMKITDILCDSWFS